MKEIIKFLSEVGKLKGMPRRGWVIRDIKNPESIAEHTFRSAMMAWVLASKKHKKLNLEKLLKIALVHDICEVYAGDSTPYDSILPKDKKKRQELLKTWPRFSAKEKIRLAKEKYNRESEGLERIISSLSPKMKSEMRSLWLECENESSPEGKFFKHVDKIESFLQAAEYWRAYKKPPLDSFWIRAHELHDDPILLEFIENISKEFYKGK